MIQGNTDSYSFTKNGGEMGKLIRSIDWSKNLVGPVEGWPQSLKTTLSIILSSKFPMFLFWGPDLICFYNDAYRPSLGNNGKHPMAMGQRGEECWPEIWDAIKPLIDQVLGGGEATWSEDQLLPIFRNGKMEDVYWTFSYSPVNDESGKPAGVFVTCSETTQKVQTLKAIQENEKNFRNLVMQAPVGIAILKGDDFFVELANDNYLELTDKQRENFVGKPLWEVLPEAKDQGFDELLKNVMRTGIAYTAKEYQTDLIRNGKPKRVYVNFVYEPLKELDGTVNSIMVIVIEVTDIVEAKNKIEYSEERARLAADAVGLGTFDVDLNTGEMATSSYFDTIFGFDHHVPRAEFVSVIHPDDLEIRSKAHADALITGRLFYEGRVIWKDNSVHWIRVEGKVYYDNGKPQRILGTLLDITDLRSAGEEQRKLITLVDNSVDLMSILNMDGTNSYINEAGMNILGFENLEQVRTTPISDLHLPEDFEYVQTEVLPKVMSEGRWAGTMMVRHLQTGEVFQVYNNCIRIDDPVSGEPLAVGAVMRDMRPEIAAKQALADREQLLRNITTAAPAGLWMSDDEGKITYVNQTWVDWTGRHFDSHLGDGWIDSVIPEDRQKVAERFVTDLEAKAFYEVDFRINHSDGTNHWCIAMGKPQYNTDGLFTGYIGSFSDITEQKNLQQQKDDFIGIASHELKTPVTSIKAYTQVLERMVLKSGQTKEAEMISRMDGQLNRLTSLIGDLLDVTKINSGKLQFNDRDFDFNLLVKELIEDLQRTTEKHTLIENLKETGIIHADRERIGQVITNLITNAIKYSPHTDKIIIHTDLKDNCVTLCVEDFGIGISKDKLEKVFEQFYRVSGDMQHTFPGLGLGLYISSEIIKREGGKIWVESVEGKGSTFCFSLPVDKAGT